MSLVLVGIDEAGYGPTLGPLCVGMSAFGVTSDQASGKTPDLWELLSDGVCREPGRGGKPDRLGRVAVADSKQLKLPNSVRSTHPLVHLERGVLAFARQMLGEDGWTDAALFDALGVAADAPACYQGEPQSLPLSMSEGELALAAARIENACARAGVETLALRADVTWEPVFNRRVTASGNKADVVLDAVGRHVRLAWQRWAGCAGDDGTPRRLGIACDRLGGRIEYAQTLARMVPGASIEIVEEGPIRSRYVLTQDIPEPKRAGIVFLTEGESSHLPVALASMVAKFVRELSMNRFNAYWCARARGQGLAEPRPTAGYALDARRWLDDAAGLLSPGERRELVRIA